MFSDSIVQKIRESIDIGFIIGEYVSLKKTGSNLQGLCPFHQEKSPSFFVHPERGFYHCFGCGISGDVFNFLMKIEGLSFVESVYRLAERAHVQIEQRYSKEDLEYRRCKEQNERLYSILNSTTTFFLKHSKEHPLAYLANNAWVERKLERETVKKFSLGYAPIEWNSLESFLVDREYSYTDIEMLGLIIAKRNTSGYYDRFRHRLIFPIKDVQGRVVGFSGRALPSQAFPSQYVRYAELQHAPKYMNSPESAIYSKRMLLYGLFESRVEIRRLGYAILCEGNFDVLALHQAGFANSLAPLGTALTSNQAKLLRRYTNKVILMFDGDQAGRHALRSSFEKLFEAGLDVRLVLFDDGDDPDNFLRREGRAALKKRIELASDIIEYFIDDAAQHVTSPRDVTDKLRSLQPILHQISSSLEMRIYLERVARRFQIQDMRVLERTLGLNDPQGVIRHHDSQGSSISNSHVDLREPYGFSNLESDMIGLLLDCPALLIEKELEVFETLIINPHLHEVYKVICKVWDRFHRLDLPTLIASLERSPVLSWLLGRVTRPKCTNEKEAIKEIRIAIPILHRKWVRTRLNELSHAILKAQQIGNHEEADAFRKKHTALLQTIRAKERSL